MRKGRLDSFISDIKKHPLYYASWLFLLIVGISCGCVCMRLTAKTDASPLIQSISKWLEGYVYGKTNIGKRIVEALMTHGRWLLLLALAGLFRFGSLFVFTVPLIKGFGMGVVAGMLKEAYGLRGVLLSLAVLGLQNLFLIPCFAYAGSVALMHIRIRQSMHKAKRYISDLTLPFIFFLIASIIEIALIPWLIANLGGSYV